MADSLVSMNENISPNVWLWKDPDSRWKNKVHNYIKNIDPIDKDVIVLHCQDYKGFDESLPLSNYLLNICLMFKAFENERIMFLNPKDFILAIELCLGREQHKNDILGTEIVNEEIIECHKTYLEQFTSENIIPSDKVVLLKEFLEQNNCTDLWLMYDKMLKCENYDAAISYMNRFKFLILGAPEACIIKKLTSIVAGDKELFNIYVESPLNASLQGSPSQSSQEVEITTELLNSKDISLSTTRETELDSASEEYVEDVITAFLSLLVNSRNELALSKSMISPVINFSHSAFTELKHLSTEKDMPMCQVAISYVTRVRLGGKGYAPAPDCPMLPHLKELEHFVDTLNQMQTVVEEDSDPKTAIKRLIHILKKKLLKCGNKIKAQAVENAAMKLNSTLQTITELIKPKIATTESTLLCQEALDILYSFLNYVNCNYWVFDPAKILLKKEIERTPLNLPPLLGYFRTPEEESSCDAKSTFNEDSVASITSQAPSVTTSYFHHSESSSVSVSCIDATTPSKMSFKGVLSSGGNRTTENKADSHKPISCNMSTTIKNRKRLMLNDITNENLKVLNNKGDNKQLEKKSRGFSKGISTESKGNCNKKITKKESKSSKKFKLIPGQGKITSFFTMGNK